MHGTPLSPRTELLKLAGKCFFVPFSDSRDADTCMQIGQMIGFDNGAYGIKTRGGELDLMKLYPWLERYLGHPHWGVVPDVIDGSVDEQRALIKTWPFPRELGAPVWHLGLPIDYLLELADAWPRICFGSSGAYWQVGSPLWARRMDDAFDALARRHRYLPWTHMLRGLALCGDRWPFASADSVNVARNFKDGSTCPERMARNIDARQSPNRWTVSLEQIKGGLFG